MVEVPKIIPKSIPGRQNSLPGKSTECQTRKKNTNIPIKMYDKGKSQENSKKR